MCRYFTIHIKLKWPLNFFFIIFNSLTFVNKQLNNFKQSKLWYWLFLKIKVIGFIFLILKNHLNHFLFLEWQVLVSFELKIAHFIIFFFSFVHNFQLFHRAAYFLFKILDWILIIKKKDSFDFPVLLCIIDKYKLDWLKIKYKKYFF